jgi:hypothetical protein
MSTQRDNFHLQQVMLLQPEDVMGPRLPGGAGALGQYLQAVQAALTQYYSTSEDSGPRSLIVALGPGGRAQFWLGASGPASTNERASVRQLSAAIVPPVVQEGPVVLALVYSIGATPTPQQSLTLPTEWQEVVQRNGAPLPVDTIVERLWAEPQ